MKRLVFLIFGLAVLFSVSAQTRPVILKGLAPEYAGRKIDLQTLPEPVTGNTESLATINILPDGSFETSVLINRTTYAFAAFDRWKAELYLEPGANYELNFPPHQPLTESEKRNPYFQLQPIVFGIKNSSKEELNQRIDAFDRAYSLAENRYFNSIFKDKSAAATDSMIALLDKQFPASEQSFFGLYKFYRLAAVRFAQHPENNNDFIRKYLDRSPIPLDLPAWQHLFEQEFSNFFFNESNQVGGEAFRNMVVTANLSALEQYMQRQKSWSPALSHLVILESIRDAYYQARFNPKAMLVMLDKIAQSGWTTREKKIASELKEKLLYLSEGTPAPELTGKTLQGENFKLNNLNGKLIYLHFTSVGNPICRQHLDELKANAQAMEGKIEIINLIPESNAAKKELILQQNWPGTFVLVNDQNLEKYRVKTFPTAYLIDEQGKMLLSPALNPIDGFAKQLAGILRQHRVDQMRNQSR